MANIYDNDVRPSEIEPEAAPESEEAKKTTTAKATTTKK